MNINIVARKDNRTLFVSVASEEVQEAIEIMERMGFTITSKEPVSPMARFRGIKSNCLKILREMELEANRKVVCNP